MPLPADDAVTRRDDALARTRRASRWITTAAIAAAVTLGAAFAHALPGHHGTAQAATAPASAGGRTQGAGTHGGRHPARHQHAGSHHHRNHHHLQPATQPPTHAPAPPPSTPPPPPVVSGGS
jgi:hypothetical protein